MPSRTPVLGEVIGPVGREDSEVREVCSCNSLAVGRLSHVHTSWEIDHKPADSSERRCQCLAIRFGNSEKQMRCPAAAEQALSLFSKAV